MTLLYHSLLISNGPRVNGANIFAAGHINWYRALARDGVFEQFRNGSYALWEYKDNARISRVLSSLLFVDIGGDERICIYVAYT